MKWSLAILLLSTSAASAGLVDERKPIEDFPCNMQIFPDKHRCPVEYQRILKAISKRRPPTKVDHLEDRIERLELEIEGLRNDR